MNMDNAQHECAIYIDLEWNCWDGPPLPGRHQDIIEIGVVELDLKTLQLTGEKDYLIRPPHLDISVSCMQITGLTAADLKAAAPFPEVIRQFEADFQPQGKLCCTWGTDAAILASSCDKYKIPCPIRNRRDVGHLFWHAFLLRDQPSLRRAIEILELPFDGIAHTAWGDARNTARVHAEMIRRIRQEPRSFHHVPAPPHGPEQPTVMAEKLRQALRK